MANSQHSSHQQHNHNGGGSWLFSRTGLATVAAVSVLAFLIYQGHGLHLLGYAPFLLIFACPLMHIFMHGGHGGHGGHRHHDDSDDDDRDGGDCCGGGHDHAQKRTPNDTASNSSRSTQGE